MIYLGGAPRTAGGTAGKAVSKNRKGGWAKMRTETNDRRHDAHREKPRPGKLQASKNRERTCDKQLVNRGGEVEDSETKQKNAEKNSRGIERRGRRLVRRP